MEQKMNKVLLVLCVAFVSVNGRWTEYENVMQRIQNNETLLRAWNERIVGLHSEMLGEGNRPSTAAAFPCVTSQSVTRPTSVHALRAGDIGVVAAMGDSITAGNGINAWTPIGCLTNYRGYSWSAGGVQSYGNGVITLPNMLKEHTGYLYGFSTGTGGPNSRHAKMNVAVAGNVAGDMPEQARVLVQKMQSDDRLSFLNDWKLVTLFIGGNDLCDYCKDEARYSVENYVANIRVALDYLHANLPRTFVNVVSIFDITPVASMSDGIICDAIHWSVCSCGSSEEHKPVVRRKAREYADAVENLIASGRYDTNDQFTAVLQPFMRDVIPPMKADRTIDLSYFAPDCFHFSRKGHASVSKMLYSAMFEPVGHKRTSSDFESDITCPPKEAFLATAYNSLSGEATVFKPRRIVPEIHNSQPIAASGGEMFHRALLIPRFHNKQRTAVDQPEHNTGSASDNVALGLGITVGVLGVLLIACFVGMIYYKRKQNPMVPLIT